MKKLLLAIAMLFTGATALHGQASGKSLGLSLRTGQVVELSFQSATSDLRRFELDLGLNGIGVNNINLAGIWHTIYPVASVRGMNWYVGGGARLGIYNVFEDFSAGVVFGAGLEYNIASAPITFSLDWRPSFMYMTWSNKFFLEYGNIGLSVRFRF